MISCLSIDPEKNRAKGPWTEASETEPQLSLYSFKLIILVTLSQWQKAGTHNSYLFFITVTKLNNSLNSHFCFTILQYSWRKVCTHFMYISA
jgi:hypothetical protein